MSPPHRLIFYLVNLGICKSKGPERCRGTDIYRLDRQLRMEKSGIIFLYKTSSYQLLVKIITGSRSTKTCIATLKKNISRYISYKMSNKKLGLFQKNTLIYEHIFFNMLPFAGDQAGDTGIVLTYRVRWIPGVEGVIFS